MDQSLEAKNPQLNLIHFVKGPPASIQVRQLPIPSSIRSELELDEIHSIAVDDHLGVLYLANQDGFIFAVPFA
jgi:myo-inositol-hexaphosphate 3-phosphohydrolase